MTSRATYRRCTGLLAVASILLAAGVGLRAEVAGAAAAPQARLVQASYTGAAGTLTYDVYVPASYVPGTPVPLVVAMHGCGQSAEVFRKLTHFDQLADAKNLIVVFPEQNSRTNSQSCWNWFKNEHMQRGAGEPSLLAGITQRVRDRYSIDPRRIYATGLSAGGAMASVMAATYPDVFAAVGVGSGCEYGATATCAGDRSIDPEAAGEQAYKAMGAQKRVVPVIVVHGDQDKTVPLVNSEQVVAQWKVTDDWADNGARDDSVPVAPTGATLAAVPNGRSYTVARYSDGHGGELLQYWVVHGMGHAWSGGCSCEPYSDPSGPDETGAMYDFFMSHPAP
jgi:poly(hydroxyalkanoate) depolymerase family esterase